MSTMSGLPHNHFGAIYADPPWSFRVWGNQTDLFAQSANKFAQAA